MRVVPMEELAFTAAHKERLTTLRRLVVSSEKEMLRADGMLRNLNHILMALAAIAFGWIMFLPEGRGENIFSMTFPIVALVLVVLFFITFKRKNDIRQACHDKFYELHGKEHKELLERENAARKRTPMTITGWWKSVN